MNKNVSSQNKWALGLLAIVFAAALAVLSLPTYRFVAGVYTKKSPNTFVGDDKYHQVRGEVDAVAEEYRAGGFEVTVQEDVTERTNSKGEKTSLITFTVIKPFDKNGFSFMGAGLTPSIVMIGIVAGLALSAIFAFGGTLGSLSTPYRDLQRNHRLLRQLSAVCALIAALLVPIFLMTNTVTFSRKVSLYNNDAVEQGKDALFGKLDAFLFDGLAGDGVGDALKNLTFQASSTVWLVLFCAVIMMLCALKLSFGDMKNTVLRGCLYAFVIALCIFILYPYYVMLITGFRSNAETTDIYFRHLFPTKWVFSNLTDILQRGVLRYLFNSLLIAGGATFIALVCGIPAAYAMARMKFKGKKLFLGFVIMSQMFSPVVLLIGIAQLISAMRLNDSILGLMLINAAFNQAFAIWLLRGTFVSISPEMEQAARIDGCTTIGSLWHVLLPMAAPGIVTTLIFIFINAWNEYTISTVLTKNNKPITVGITQFSSFNMIEWQYLFAASLLATIPVVILFMFIEKHLTAGLTSGGVKG